MPGAEEPNLTSLIAFDVGNRLHARVQAAFARLYPESWKDEVTWSLPPDDLVTGRADGFYLDEDGIPTVVEIKTMNPMSYSRANRRDMPSADHALQAHLSAFVLGAQAIHIVYVNKAGKQDEEPVAEWLAEANLFLAEIELMRLRAVVQQTHEGILPDRFYDGDTIENPLTRRWPCQWCAWREQCVQLGPGDKQLLHPKVAKRSATTLRVLRSEDGDLKAI